MVSARTRGWFVGVGVTAALVAPVLIGRSIEGANEAADQASRVSLSSLGLMRSQASGGASAASAAHAAVGPVNPGVRQRLDSLEHRLETSPDDRESRLQFARLLENSHRLPQAIEEYRTYLDGVPADPEGWLDLGRALAASRDWDGAAEAMSTLLALDPSDPSALYNMGAIEANRGRYEEAATWWRRVVYDAADSTLAKRATASLERLARAR